MKALVWTNPNEMIVKEIDKPIPHKGEVLIHVFAAGICGSELSGYKGENSLRKPPLVMGHEFSGMVEDIGADVDSSLNGRNVVINPLISCKKCHFCRNGFENLCLNFSLVGAHRQGAFAEWVVVPDYVCFPVDKKLGEIEGTLVEPLACGLRSVRLGGIGISDKVVIFGAGIIGLSALKVAKMAGATELIVIDTNPKRLDIAEAWGATKTINASQEEVVSKCHNLSNRIGMDVVIDAVGLAITRQQSVDIIRRGGRIILVGLHTNETEFPGNAIVRSEISLVGSFAYTFKDFQDALHLMNDKFLKPAPNWLDKRSLEDGDRSFQELISGSDFSKIILKP